MGIRTIERQIAKARMKAMGVGNVNKKMSAARRDEDGKRKELPIWRRVLTGDLAKQGLAAQLGTGAKSKRKLRRVKG